MRPLIFEVDPSGKLRRVLEEERLGGHFGRGLAGHVLMQEEMACGICGLPFGMWHRYEPCPGKIKKHFSGDSP